MIQLSKTTYRFTVEGPLLGYRASIKRAFDPKYRQFKDRVFWTARQAGFEAEKHDPQLSDVFLSVWLFWKRSPRIDFDNVKKAIQDAVWKQDRWIRPGVISGFKEYSERPECAEVLIEVKEK